MNGGTRRVWLTASNSTQGRGRDGIGASVVCKDEEQPGEEQRSGQLHMQTYALKEQDIQQMLLTMTLSET